MIDLNLVNFITVGLIAIVVLLVTRQAAKMLNMQAIV